MKKIFSIMIALAMVLSMINAPMASAATAVDIGEDWAVWFEDDCSTGNSWVPYYVYNMQLNKTHGYVNNAHSTQVGSVTDANHFMAMNTNLAVDGDFAAEFDLFMDDLSYATTLKKPGYFRLGVYSDLKTKESDTSKKQYSSLYYETVASWDNFNVKDDNGTAYKATTARASKKYGVEAVATVPDTFGAVSEEDEHKYLNMRFVSVGDNISVYVKWDNSSQWRNLYDDTITSYDGAKGFVFHWGAFVGVDNLKIYRPYDDIPKTPMMETEEWGIQSENDFSSNITGIVPYYSYYIGHDSTYGFVRNSLLSTTYWGDARNANHWLGMAEGIKGDFAIDFDYFMDDIAGENFLVSDTSDDCTFRLKAYAGELTKSGNYNKLSTELCSNLPVWKWTVDGLADDNGTKYTYSAAKASSKYASEPTDGTPSWLDVRVVLIGDTLTAYAKWNTASKWKQVYTSPLASTEEARGLVLVNGANTGIDNFKILRPVEDIPKTPMQESDTWGIQNENDFSTNKDGLVAYYNAYYLAHNKTYGFAWQGHSSNYKDAWNQNHWTGMAEGIEGDFAVDFDYFINDIDVPADTVALFDSSTDNTFRMNVYAGELYKEKNNGSANNNYLSPRTSVYYNSNVWGWTATSLADDNDTMYKYNAARASKKYVSAPTDGTPSWLDMRVVLIGDTITTYVKWNTASEWKELFTGAVTPTDDVRGLIFRNGSNAGIDNFKVLRPKENIVKTPTVATAATLLNSDGVDNMIVKPHFGTPAFTEPNGTVDIEFTNNTGVDFAKGTIDVYLSNEYKAWYAKATTPKSGENNIYLGTKSGWTTTITVPADISPELMDLEIIHTAQDGTRTTYFAPQSVNVTEALNQNFYSVAISDTHISGMGNEYSTTKAAKILKYMNDSLTIANPRYLSHSGDIHDLAIPDRATFVKETMGYAFKDATVPFIVVAGNHEYDTYTYPVGESLSDGRTAVTYEEYTAGLAAAADAEAYKKSVQVKSTFTEQTFDEFYGTKTAAIKMGEDMLIAKNDFGAWVWQTTDRGDGRYRPIFHQLRDGLATEWEKDEYDGDYRVVYQHCYNTGKRTSDGGYAVDVYGTAAFMSPTCHEGSENMTPYDVQYTGHYHEVYAENDKVLTLGGSGKNEANWGGNGVISNFTYNANAEGKKWSNSINELLLNSEHVYDKENVDNIQDYLIKNSQRAVRAVYDEYYNENNGTAEFNIATVTNTKDFNFYDGRVKFIMAPGKTYTVENGTKLAQYDSYDGKYTIVLAKVNIPAATAEADGVVNVTVKAADYAGADLVLEGAETGYVGSDVTYLDLVSTAGTSFTASEITVKNNGYDAEFTVSNQGTGITRITFTDALTPNSSYTVATGEKEFGFNVLPDDGIIFLDNTLKLGGGYQNTASGTSGNRMKVQTGTDESGNAVYTYANDFNYENYVLDYTIVMTSGVGIATAGYESADVTMNSYSTDNAGTMQSKSVVKIAANQDSVRPGSLAQSVLTNPLDIKAGYSYDFRIVKYNDTYNVYAKLATDDRYDLIASMSGAANGIYSGAGRTDVYFVNRSANTLFYNYKLYPIENTVTVDEKVGQEFDVTFDVQPKDLSSVTIDGVGDVTFTKTGVKTYKATMPSTWTKKSADAVLSGITDIYSITAPDATLSAAEYEIDMRDVTITQNNEETDSVVAGDYEVKVICDKNYTLPENAKIICASYAADGSLASIQTKDTTEMVYNGSDYTFELTSTVDVAQIKLFAFAMNTLAPLAKSIQ